MGFILHYFISLSCMHNCPPSLGPLPTKYHDVFQLATQSFTWPSHRGMFFLPLHAAINTIL